MTVVEAAACGDMVQLRALLEAGGDPNEADDSGCTALTYAANCDRLEMVEELLRAGADPNHRDNDTETVLMWAADHAGNAAVLRALLQAGADVNAKSDIEETALSWTMRHGDLEMIRVLLDAGADVNACNALSQAAYSGFAPVVRLLLEKGADLRAADTDWQTMIAIAKNRGHREVANLLRQAEADRKLRETGETYPPPRYPLGTRVRTPAGMPYEGWIAFAEWNHKHGRYGYYIEIEKTSKVRKPVSKRYWEEDLQTIPEQNMLC